MKAAAHAIRPSVWIGKRGLSPTQIAEIRAQLERKKLIKVKVLKSALGAMTMRQIAAQIAEHARARIEGMTGMVIVVGRLRDE